MKTPDQVLGDIRRRVANNWASDITAVTATWPHTFPLGQPTRVDLATNFAAVQRLTFHWRDWARTHDLTLTDTRREVTGTIQSIPSHVLIPDLDTAAGLLGPEWVRRIRRGRARAADLADQFPQVDAPGKIVRATDTYADTDFGLLCSSAHWFRDNTASGLTPRQVPIEGLHAKWLNRHQGLLQTLAGVDDLGLLPRHPRRLHFTYLDPDHLTAGRRRHDSATVGDQFTPAYLPEVVIISENKDSAIFFPELPDAISVEGAGWAAAEVCASLSWIRACPNLIYWGDLDASGFEIVNNVREVGVPVATMLMDLATFDTYHRFGSSTDEHGNPLKMSTRRDLPWLTGPERALYERLTDPTWTGFRRIEHERIPLSVALAAVKGQIARRAPGWPVTERTG